MGVFEVLVGPDLILVFSVVGVPVLVNTLGYEVTCVLFVEIFKLDPF